MLKYKADWVEPDVRDGDESYELYPNLSLADWHKNSASGSIDRLSWRQPPWPRKMRSSMLLGGGAAGATASSGSAAAHSTGGAAGCGGAVASTGAATAARRAGGG